MNLSENCTCGAAIKLFGTDDDVMLAESLLDQWQTAHVGAGHVACSAADARLVRAGYRLPRWRTIGEGERTGFAS